MHGAIGEGWGNWGRRFATFKRNKTMKYTKCVIK